MTIKNDITFTIEDINPCEKKFNLVVSASRVRANFKEVVDSYKSQVKVSGFREGTAPRAIIMKKYGTKIKESVQQRLIEEASKFVFTENKNIVPLIEIDKDFSDVKEGKNYNFSFIFEVAPEFSLPNYKNFKLEATKQDINDEVVEETIKMILLEQARLGTVDDVAQKDDFVKCEVKCFDSEKEIVDLFDGDNRWVIMSDGGQFPSADKFLLGKKMTDKVKSVIDFPADYSYNEKVQGKTIEFEFTISEVQRRIAPNLNEDFLKQNQLESVEQFKENIRQDLEKSHKSQRQNELTEKIVDLLIEQVQCTLPPRTLEDQIKNIIYQMIHKKEQHQQGEQCNHNSDDVDEATKKLAVARAEKSLKTSFIMEKIAEVEKVEVKQDEILARLQEMASRYQMPLEELIKQLSDGNELVHIQMQIKHENTIQKIIEFSEIVEVEKDAKS